MRQHYTLRDIAALFGLSRSAVMRLVAAGFVSPSRGPRREWRFGFQDLVLLRTAHTLRQAQVPARRIVAALQRLRAQLPAELPLTGLRIDALGGQVVVREAGRPWTVDSGQAVFDFDLPPARPAPVQSLRARAMAADAAAPAAAVATKPPAVTVATKPPPAPGLALSEADAAHWLAFGAALEASDAAAAEAAYRHAIAAAPRSADAYLNLGVLLGAQGRHLDAVAVYQQALQHEVQTAALLFNLGVALEDVNEADAALRAYTRCLALDAAFADAHFNAARLHERAGHARQAIRHYSAYRRLSRQ